MKPNELKYPYTNSYVKQNIKKVSSRITGLKAFYEELNKKVYNKLMKNRRCLFLLLRLIAYPSLVGLDYADIKVLMTTAKDISFEIVSNRNYKKANLRKVKDMILIFLGSESISLDEISNTAEYFCNRKPKYNIIWGAMVANNLKKNQMLVLIIKLY